jgi:hypothetical protein
MEGVYAQISIPFDSVRTESIRLKSEDECNGDISSVDRHCQIGKTGVAFLGFCRDIPNRQQDNQVRTVSRLPEEQFRT